MRILIKDASNNQTILCDGPGRGLDRNTGPLDGIMFDDQINVQPGEILRAASAKAWNRGNKRTQVGFRISREMASANAAHVWQAAFHAQCIRAGMIEFTGVDSNGTERSFTLSDAVISNIKTTPLGVTRLVEFSIVGGAIT